MTDDLLPQQIKILREMTFEERFARGLRFLQITREWLAAGVRARNPSWHEDLIQAETRRLISNGES